MRSARVISNAKSSLVHTPGWQDLIVHHNDIKSIHMMELFDKDPDRFAQYSLQFEGLMLDYSKNIITDETLKRLFRLARQQDVEGWRDKMFAGSKINNTEGRSVLHTALRNRSNKPIMVDGEDVMPKVDQVLEQMHVFSDKVRSGEWKGCSGKRITPVPQPTAWIS